MRWSLALLLLLMVANAAHAHVWRDDPCVAPEWNGCTDAVFGCAGGEMFGYGLASEWADEVQVCFELPEPPEGGPWLIEYVAFFVSGEGSHRVMLRQVGNRYSAPGDLIADDLAFTPIYETWPPEEWTYVPLKGSSACNQLPTEAGQCISVGIELRAGDAIGLSADEPGTRGWSLCQGSWIDDSQLNLTSAVRIGLTDLGVSEANIGTWGAIKQLFTR